MKTVIEAKCIKCGKIHKLTVQFEDYEKWLNGEGKIQHLLPYLRADERELLLSGICGKCFDKMFGEDW